MSWGHGLIRQAISGKQATGVLNKLSRVAVARRDGTGESGASRCVRGFGRGAQQRAHFRYTQSSHNMPLIITSPADNDPASIFILVGLNLWREKALTSWRDSLEMTSLSTQGRKEPNHLAIISNQAIGSVPVYFRRTKNTVQHTNWVPCFDDVSNFPSH